MLYFICEVESSVQIHVDLLTKPLNFRLTPSIKSLQLKTPVRYTISHKECSINYIVHITSLLDHGLVFTYS